MDKGPKVEVMVRQLGHFLEVVKVEKEMGTLSTTMGREVFTTPVNETHKT